MDSDSVGCQIKFNSIRYVLKFRKNKWAALIDSYPYCIAVGKEEEISPLVGAKAQPVQVQISLSDSQMPKM